MKTTIDRLLSVLLFIFLTAIPTVAKSKIRIITSIASYASIAKEVVGPRAQVDTIAHPRQDPHFVLPKPSHARKLMKADLYVSTGLDLELWEPAVIDKSGNRHIRSGQAG